MSRPSLEEKREARRRRREKRRGVRRWIVIGAAVVGTLLALLGIIAELTGYKSFRSTSGSMLPTIRVDERLAGLQNERAVSAIEAGDIVIYEFPQESAKRYLADQPETHRHCIQPEALERPDPPIFLKRVVATAGQTIEVRDNQLYIDEKPVPQEFVSKETTGNFLYPHRVLVEETLGEQSYQVQFSGADASFGPLEVPGEHVFVMGDNRDNSSDSRCWGPLPVLKLKGRLFHVMWSSDDDGVDWDRVGHRF